jgi:glycosyltransferase involved in cell wall biosynthesis
MSNIKQSLRVIFLVEFVHEQGTYFRWHNLAIGLQLLGHHVTVYAIDWDRFSKDRVEYRDGVEYRILSTFRGLSIFTPSTNPLNLLRRLAIRYPTCDVVHSFQPFPFSAYLGWYLKRTGRARTFFYDWDDLWTKGLHKDIPGRLSTWISYLLVRRTEAHMPALADVVTVCSCFLQNLTRAAGNRCVRIIHNGFTVHKPMDKQQARAQLGLQPDVIYAGFIGRTLSELSWCISAMQTLQEQANSCGVRMVLCGMPTDSLKAIPPGLTEHIDYLGQLSPIDCRVLATAIDLGLMPLEDNAFNQSRFPIKFAEYQASGTPVLYSQVGECNMFSRIFSWNIPAGKTYQSFIDAFIGIMSLGKIELSERKVNIHELALHLEWRRMASLLASTYQERLNVNT